MNDTSPKYLLMLKKAEEANMLPKETISLGLENSFHQIYCPEHLQVVAESSSCSVLCPHEKFRPILTVEDLNSLLEFSIWRHYPTLEKFLLFCKDNRRRFKTNEQYLLAFYAKTFHSRKWVPSVKEWLCV